MKESAFTRKTLLVLVALFSLYAVATKAFARVDDEHAGGEEGRVYVMSNAAAGNTVIVFHRDEDGSLLRIQEVSTGGRGSGPGVLPAPLPPLPGPDPLQSQDSMVMARDGRFLLVVNAGSNEVSVLATGHDGLQLVSKTASGGAFPVSIAEHRNLVYVLNEGESPNHSVGGVASITGFRLDAHGNLNAIANSTQVIGADTGTSDLLFSPAGDALVVTEMFTNRIDLFPVGVDGTLGERVTIPSNKPTPFGAAFRADNVMVVTEINAGAFNGASTSSYQLFGDGSLQPVSKAVGTTRTGSCWVRFSHDGSLAYTGDTGSGTISIYQVSAQGELTLHGFALSGGPFSGPLDLDLSSNGKFLYLLIPLGQIGNSPPIVPAPPTAARIQGYRVEEDGSLTPVTTVGDIPFTAQGIVAR